jgi:hypothetical protein
MRSVAVARRHRSPVRRMSAILGERDDRLVQWVTAAAGLAR